MVTAACILLLPRTPKCACLATRFSALTRGLWPPHESFPVAIALAPFRAPSGTAASVAVCGEPLRQHGRISGMHKINEEDERCVHKPELLARTGKSYTHLLKLMAQGLFPKPRDFNGRPAWLNSELVAWF